MANRPDCLSNQHLHGVLISASHRTPYGVWFIPQRPFCLPKVATGHSLLSRSGLHVHARRTFSPFKFENMLSRFAPGL
ncbi:hypothetical protein JTE90_000958 [Oedothorax gibbosus]|uniref:Uncharacterized protein n=1 Tax=Oedothorax gibbosus TaxID=931172 RepID=A0AAV6TIS3_9ARAC|nr:hypothetical protein JTE90_000958 [Oedothorax gibbosus]